MEIVSFAIDCSPKNIMLRNYIKIAFRNLLRYRVFSFINILGPGLGIEAFVFIR